MNILITIVLVIIGLIALLLIIALFIKKDYNIERDHTIYKPCQKVFDYVKHIKNQDYYSKWVMTDPQMKKDFKGTDGTVGFIYAWNGNDKAGEGEQEIKNLIDGQRIDTEVRFKRPFKSTANIYTTTESLSDQETKVKWGMTGYSPYPLNLMTLLMSNKLGRDLEISLGNLKLILEK